MPAELNWAIVVVGYLLAFVTIMRIVLQRREPTATLAWALWVIFVPYIGVASYILFGRRRLDRQLRRRRARASVIEPHLARLGEAVADMSPASAPAHLARPDERDLVQITNRIGSRLPTCGNKVELLVDADAAYLSMERAIEAATDHVNFQFYIYQSDETGKRFRDLLIRKVEEGVRVRVLTDGVGSFGIDTFLIPLVQAGGRHAEFLPVGRFSRHWHPNLRNHRKIVVVDGKVAFTGGVNIGDEYTGRKRRVGHWRDTHMRIEGPAVYHVQEVFAEDWHFTTGERVPDKAWFPEQKAVGDEMVQMVASGPDSPEETLQRIFFAAVTVARKRVFMTTPYFIPDQAMLVALETSALRGVDVRVLLPARSDQGLVLHAGRSYYDELLKNGVRIYEYLPGILHAKTMLVDDTWATVGSANMDVRSFRLNFEMNAAVYGPNFANQLAAVFNRDLKQAQLVTEEARAKRSVPTRVAESLARILSPVL